MAAEGNQNRSNNAEILIPQNGSAYYEYLKDIKNGEFYSDSDYLTVFMMF